MNQIIFGSKGHLWKDTNKRRISDLKEEEKVKDPSSNEFFIFSQLEEWYPFGRSNRLQVVATAEEECESLAKCTDLAAVRVA